jgi:hypothetical protein
VEPAVPLSFVEPAAMGWPAASFSPETAAPGPVAVPEPGPGLRARRWIWIPAKV